MDGALTRLGAVLLAGFLLAVALAGCSGAGDETRDAPSAATERAERAALHVYRSYLAENAADLDEWTTKLWGQLAADELTRAQSRYATSRVQYGQIQPTANEFGTLNARIDAPAEEAPASGFGGFHRIEKALFAEETTAGVNQTGKHLHNDVESLRRQLRTIELQPQELAEASARTAGEVSTSVLANREEIYADLDLVDAAAGLEGAQAAFEAVKPLLVGGGGRPLAKRIDSQFDAVYEALSPYGAPAHMPEQSRPRAAGAVFVLFSELSPDSVRELKEPVEALAASLAQVPGRI